MGFRELLGGGHVAIWGRVRPFPGHGSFKPHLTYPALWTFSIWLFLSYDKPTWHIKKQRHYFADQGLSTQRYGFSSSHVWMWELDHKERWALKNWCFWTVVLKTTLESPLDCKEIKPVNPKGNQSWLFIGKIDVEAEVPILWPPDAKSWLIVKRPWC